MMHQIPQVKAKRTHRNQIVAIMYLKIIFAFPFLDCIIAHFIRVVKRVLKKICNFFFKAFASQFMTLADASLTQAYPEGLPYIGKCLPS